MISEFRIRELPTQEFDFPDLLIRSGRVPHHLPIISDSGLFYEATKNDFLLRFERFGVSFRIQNGNLITVDLKNGKFLIEHEVFLMTSVIGILLHQTSILPLHGSSISTERGAYIFTGKSSSGKSSLAAEFYFKGYQIISDDIAALSHSPNNHVLLHKGLSYLKLWEDVLFSFTTNKYFERVRPEINKYLYPIKNYPNLSTENIAGVIVLSSSNLFEFRLSKISGIERVKVLNVNTYRYRLIKALRQEQKQFKIITSLAKGCNFFLLERPRHPIRLKELREFIENNIFLDAF